MKMKKGKKPIGMLMFLTVAVSLVMVMGLMPGMSLTAYADNTIFDPASTYTGFETLKNGDDTVTIKEVPDKDWYVIDYDGAAGTVTLLSKQSFGDQAFNSDYSKGNDYSKSEIKSYVEGLTAVGEPLAGINGALVGEPYLLSEEEASVLSQKKILSEKEKGEGKNWWLRSPGEIVYKAEYACQNCGGFHGLSVEYEFGVRPAIKLNLASVIFKSESGSYSFELKTAGYTVTYKVVNGTWSDGTTADKNDETVQSGSKPASVPTGMKAAEGYTGGSWDTNPADVTITEAKTFTYTFTAKQAATVTKAPTAKTLTYNGLEQELVTAGTAEGGTMQYALGTKDAATGEYTTSIPVGTDAGTYYVWYKAKGDDNHTDSDANCLTATIAKEIEPSVKLDPNEIELSAESTRQLSVTVVPEGTNVIYSSSNDAVATVDNTGRVTAIAEGTASIKAAITVNGKEYSDSCTVTVKNNPTPVEASIKLNASELPLIQGRENALKATTVPEDAVITWTSSDNSVATVDASGVVKGIKVGTATITAKITVDEKDYTASCKVTVVDSSTPTITPSGTPIIIPPSGGGEHVHKYAWDTVEATEDADGELRYQCETCGDIKERVPLTAYNVFNKNTTEKIRKAPKDATVKIETSKWISFHKMVMEALAERPDVTLEISFLDEGYKGNRCTVIIPKGTDVMSLVDKNGFTGFLYLGGKFGLKTN